MTLQKWKKVLIMLVRKEKDIKFAVKHKLSKKNSFL